MDLKMEIHTKYHQVLTEIKNLAYSKCYDFYLHCGALAIANNAAE